MFILLKQPLCSLFSHLFQIFPFLLYYYCTTFGYFQLFLSISVAFVIHHTLFRFWFEAVHIYSCSFTRLFFSTSITGIHTKALVWLIDPLSRTSCRPYHFAIYLVTHALYLILIPDFNTFSGMGNSDLGITRITSNFGPSVRCKLAWVYCVYYYFKILLYLWYWSNGYSLLIRELTSNNK